jgi:prolycopene isomerase
MVFSDRHYGGINYPVGGVGKIAEKLAEGLDKAGGEIRYGARVTQIIPKAKSGKGAIGVKLANGEILYAKKVVSNATRWDTFGNLLKDEPLPSGEKGWQSRYQKSPSFLSLHLGVEASAIPDDAACHHILLEDWNDMQKEQGTIFVSIPTLLDRSLAPNGHHIVHTFTPSWMSEWEGLSALEYEEKKNEAARKLCDRLLAIFPKLEECMDYQEVGTPRSHRRFLGRADGTYGPIPAGKPLGLLGMPFNRTSIPDLYCVGDSTFPGQGLNAVAFSGFACGHLVASSLGLV